MRLENKVQLLRGQLWIRCGNRRLFAAEGAAVVVADISDEAGNQ
ncbi:MAG: hypothetical protein CM1200mP18_22360 [Gammaproteobacteria bacterium]|nr:MAG: hypothetical protein CM1200mP18_22360 [Gammaproteobacteria bacterium]